MLYPLRLLRKKLFNALFLLGISVHGFANANTQELSHLLASTTTLQARFIQQVYDQQGQVINTSEGNITIAKPNRFRWEVEKPIQQLVVSDGKTLSNYQPDLKQLIEQSVQKGMQSTPLAILSGDETVFQERYIVTKSNATTYHLTPRKKGNFKTITLSFSKGQLHQMQLYDSLGQETRLIFQDMKVNEKIASEQFTLQVPNDTDIIRDNH